MKLLDLLDDFTLFKKAYKDSKDKTFFTYKSVKGFEVQVYDTQENKAEFYFTSDRGIKAIVFKTGSKFFNTAFGSVTALSDSLASIIIHEIAHSHQTGIKDEIDITVLRKYIKNPHEFEAVAAQFAYLTNGIFKLFTTTDELIEYVAQNYGDYIYPEDEILDLKLESLAWKQKFYKKVKSFF